MGDSLNESVDMRDKEYVEKIDDITSGHIEVMQTMMGKCEHQLITIQNTQMSLSRTEKELQQLQSELDKTIHERETLRVQVGLLEMRMQNNMRQLVAELQTDMQNRVSMMAAEALRMKERKEKELDASHSADLAALNEKHAAEIAAQLRAYQQDLTERDEKARSLVHGYKKKIGEIEEQLKELQLHNRAIKRQRNFLNDRLRVMMQNHFEEALRLLEMHGCGRSLSGDSHGSGASINTTVPNDLYQEESTCSLPTSFNEATFDAGQVQDNEMLNRLQSPVSVSTSCTLSQPVEGLSEPEEQGEDKPDKDSDKAKEMPALVVSQSPTVSGEHKSHPPKNQPRRSLASSDATPSCNEMSLLSKILMMSMSAPDTASSPSTELSEQQHSSTCSIRQHYVSSVDTQHSSTRLDKQHSLPCEDQPHPLPCDDRQRSLSSDDRQRSSPFEDRQRSLSCEDRQHSLPCGDRQRSSPCEDRQHSSSCEAQQHSSPSDDRQRSSPSEDGQHSSPCEDGQHSSPSEDGQRSSLCEDRQRSSPCEDRQHSSSCDDRQHSSPNEDRQHSSLCPDRQRSSPCTVQHDTSHCVDQQFSLPIEDAHSQSSEVTIAAVTTRFQALQQQIEQLQRQHQYEKIIAQQLNQQQLKQKLQVQVQPEKTALLSLELTHHKQDSLTGDDVQNLSPEEAVVAVASQFHALQSQLLELQQQQRQQQEPLLNPIPQQQLPKQQPKETALPQREVFLLSQFSGAMRRLQRQPHQSAFKPPQEKTQQKTEQQLGQMPKQHPSPIVESQGTPLDIAEQMELIQELQQKPEHLEQQQLQRLLAPQQLEPQQLQQQHEQWLKQQQQQQQKAQAEENAIMSTFFQECQTFSQDTKQQHRQQQHKITQLINRPWHHLPPAPETALRAFPNRKHWQAPGQQAKQQFTHLLHSGVQTHKNMSKLEEAGDMNCTDHDEKGSVKANVNSETTSSDATSDTSYRNPVCQPQVALNASGEGNLNPTSQKTPFCAPANLSKSEVNPLIERSLMDIDCYKISERFWEHEERQKDLQNYVHMLLLHSSGSPSSDCAVNHDREAYVDDKDVTQLSQPPCDNTGNEQQKAQHKQGEMEGPDSMSQLAELYTQVVNQRAQCGALPKDEEQDAELGQLLRFYIKDLQNLNSSLQNELKQVSEECTSSIPRHAATVLCTSGKPTKPLATSIVPETRSSTHTKYEHRSVISKLSSSSINSGRRSQTIKRNNSQQYIASERKHPPAASKHMAQAPLHYSAGNLRIPEVFERLHKAQRSTNLYSSKDQQDAAAIKLANLSKTCWRY
ncbi:hypothetical protein LSAT2_013852 [Lamellibrachia satsuma]|nr:hypothetical protein LSAT2_013852 [Lamellibrachia satsuma]